MKFKPKGLKMNLKSLLWLSALLGFQTQGWCSTNITLSAHFGSASLTVSPGQVAQVSYAGFKSPSGSGSLVSGMLRVTVGDVSVDHSQTNETLSVLPTVVGPATISLQPAFRSPSYGWALCTINISSPADSFVPSTAVVIPADSSGPVDIILESSTDLLNWTAALPGTYGTTTTKRFFRVRAQRTL